MSRSAARGSTLVAGVLTVLVGGLALCVAYAGLVADASAGRRSMATALATALGVTDLALFNDARYTRHRAMADLHAPFQDGPSSLEHFPSGSFSAPLRTMPAGRLEAGEGSQP